MSFVIITGGDFCKTKADVVVLIQDSQGISATTIQGLKTVVRRLLTLLDSETTDYNFALATYAKSRRMSCFGSAKEIVTYMDSEYCHQQRGTQNLLELALKWSWNSLTSDVTTEKMTTRQRWVLLIMAIL